MKTQDPANTSGTVPETVPPGAWPDNSSLDGVYVFPVSHEQGRYWLLDQLGGASTASNMAIAFRLEGPVDDRLVEHAIESLSLRHEALRTTFRMVDGVLSQVISEQPSYRIDISDLRQEPEAVRVEKAEALILEHSHARIDLATGPVFLIRLIHVSDQSHYLAFTLHHITCDGWSNGILISEFAELYSAAAGHRQPNLAELPFQYADFTVWQDEWLQTSAAQSALAYWKEHIQRDLPPIDLPTDAPRTAQKSFPGHIEGVLLSPELNARLADYCRKHDSTKHQVLLAAFEALISRYANQKEFLLGSTIANRTQPGMENVIGRFAHPQVILADVKGNPSYRELLARVADWSARAYAHQDLPFSRLTEEFQLDQVGAASQFLQVYFVYQKAFMQPQQAGALKIVPRPSVSGGVNFDMLVSIVERAEGPRLQVEYNTVLFRKERIRSFIDQYVRVLEAVLANDTLKVSELPLLSAAETHTVLPAVTAVSAAHDIISLSEHFDRHAEALGDATAIASGDEQTSWKALRERSLQFAAGMRSLGITAGQIVALRMEPNTDAAAAALAALRIGAVILPVPAEVGLTEWERIFNAARPALTLASRNALDKAFSFTALDRLAGVPEPSELPAPPSPEATAWLGVRSGYDFSPISHADTLESHLKAAEALALHPGDAVLVLPAQSSTDAWCDLLLPLLAGAAIVHAAPSQPESLQSLLDRHQAAYAFGTPSDWTALAAAGWHGDRRIRLICRGGRLSSHAAISLARTRSRIWSLVSSATTAGPFGVSHVDQPSNHPWPLTSLAGDALSLEDESGHAVPFSVPGEIVIRRNAGDFRPGYLATYSPNPGFEIVERSERAVRLHGYRIRLGELEDLLEQQSSVTSASALIRTDASGKAALVAYITGQPDLPAISTWLRASAPQHLASAELVAVDSIPRRLDGSPDIDALPSPGAASTAPSISGDYAPPRDELETQLVDIWEQVLNVKNIGIHTSFFHLGGYSLTIVRLFANINRTLSTALPITTIFNAPTIEQLADVIRGRTLYSPLVPVQPKGSRPPFFMIHSYLLYGGLPSVLGEEYPFYGLRELDGIDGNMTLEERVNSYAKEIRSVQPKGPYYIGGWCAAGPLAIETARKLTESGEEVGIVVLFDSWRPGYHAELMAQQRGTPEMALSAVLHRKYRFHRSRFKSLSTNGKLKYFWNAGAHKLRSTRDKFYLRNWAFALRLFKTFGMPLPHFMHNISRDTLDLVQAHTAQPFPVRIHLIRATDATYMPGADASCGWNAMSTMPVEVEWAPGDHESMFMEPNLGVVGNLLRNRLERAYTEK